MKDVDLTAKIDVPRSKISERLSPESIIEYTNPWHVTSTKETGDDTIVTVAAEQYDKMELQFTEQPNGFSYHQLGTEGPFEHMETEIELSGDEQTEITIRSRFTFGGHLTVVKNWFGTNLRRKELEGIITSIADDVAAERPATLDADES